MVHSQRRNHCKFGCFCLFIQLDFPFYLLYLFKGFLFDDELVSIFHQIHGKLALIIHLSAALKIRRVGFLHQHLADVLFVTQYSVNSGGAPLQFSSDGFDAVSLQILLAFAHTVSIHIEIKDLPNKLGFFRNDFQHAVRPFGVSEELRMV